MDEPLYTFRLKRAAADPLPHSPHFQALMRMFGYLARPVSQGRLPSDGDTFHGLSGEFSYLRAQQLADAIEKVATAFLLDQPGRSIEVHLPEVDVLLQSGEQVEALLGRLRSASGT